MPNRTSIRTAPRWTRLCSLSLGILLVSPSAAAGPPAGEPPARRADPIPSVDDGPEDLAERPPGPTAAHAKTNLLYVNFDGVTLKYMGGKEDSAQDTSQFEKWAGTYEPYGEGSKRAASMQAVKADWAKYAVEIVEERPKAAKYVMAVVSPTNIYGGGVLGVAPLDCMDKRAGNIVLAFHGVDDWFSASTQATTISQEMAHAFGLEHVKQPDDIMNPYNAGADPRFLDECIKLDAGGGKIYCGAQHEQFCDAGLQNSHAEVVWLFGEAEPDVAPPTVTITQPKDGETYPVGSDIDVIAEAADDHEVKEVRLAMNDAPMGPRAVPPYLWPMKNFPAGSYCFVAEAEDLSMNLTTSAPVCITVSVDEGGDGTTGGGSTTQGGTGEMPPPPASTGGELPTTGGEAPTTGGEATTTTTGEPVGEGSSGGEAGPASVSATSGNPQEGQDEGCSCAEAPGAGRAGLLLVVVVAVGRRRRRGGAARSRD